MKINFIPEQELFDSKVIGIMLAVHHEGSGSITRSGNVSKDFFLRTGESSNNNKSNISEESNVYLIEILYNQFSLDSKS